MIKDDQNNNMIESDISTTTHNILNDWLAEGTDPLNTRQQTISEISAYLSEIDANNKYNSILTQEYYRAMIKHLATYLGQKRILETEISVPLT